MKRTCIVLLFLFLIPLVFLLLSCSTTKSYVPEGWVDDDTFRVSSTGAPKLGLTNKILKRREAKEAALIMAQKRILEKFAECQKGRQETEIKFDAEGRLREIKNKFSGMVKNGTIIRESYDGDDNCEILFEVRSKCLRGKVEGFSCTPPVKD